MNSESSSALIQKPLRFYIGPYKFSVNFNLVQYKIPFWDQDLNLEKSINEYPINTFLSSALIDQNIELKHKDGIVYVSSTYPRYLTDISTDFDTYQKKLGQKARYNLRKSSKKFFEQTDMNPSFKAYKTESEISEFYDLARIVSKETYQEKQLGISIPDDPKYLARLKTKAQNNEARGYLLFMNDTPIAFALALAESGTLIGEYMGFDVKYSKYSPGVVVKWESLKDLFEEQIFNWFDFTEGEGLHKRRFATHSFDCGDVFIVPPSLKNKVLFITHRGFTSLMNSLDQLLVKNNAKPTIKKWLRK